MSWKKLIIGEAMPDKDDPKYRDRYEKEVDAGRKFARMAKIDQAAVHLQNFANAHKKLFLILVFGFILLSFGFNLYKISKVYNSHLPQISVTKMQEEMVKNRHDRIDKTIQSMNGEIDEDLKNQ